jgi:hypothetical protein
LGRKAKQRYRQHIQRYQDQGYGHRHFVHGFCIEVDTEQASAH